ncbi:MAG: T9SS type B sorting domain-containing protein [Bacteroidota bacterium]
MLPKKLRHLLYAVVLLAISVGFTSALANPQFHGFLNKVASVLPEVSKRTAEKALDQDSQTSISTNFNGAQKNGQATTASAAMFMTLIQGADEEVGCSANGLTVARFNLCGNSDDRIIALSGSHSSVSWQILNGGCSPDINEDCPNTTPGCYTQVDTGSTFTLDATGIPATTGAEYRVVVDGVSYYFKVKKSTITQEHVKTDFICGVPGRIQITNLSSAYEFAIDNGSGFGPWQGPTFENLVPGTYVVKARLRGVPNTCEYPYEPITIDELDMDIGVTFTDAQCFGDTGTITVTAYNVPGPYKYTLLDGNGVPQEFTAFLPETENPYTFSAVGFGTYIVQVETQQCNGDPANGINPPRASLDDSGNPIVIGAGLTALDASTEVNNSFGCTVAPNEITSVDIILNATGGAPPYTFTVNGGPSQPAFTGTTTHTVTGPGTYDFVIIDANNCTITASASVEDLLPPDVTASGLDGDCTNGGARINFTVNDARGYNLSYRVRSTDPWETAPSISVTATPAGTLYDEIEVRYQQGGFECTMPLPDITVTNVGAIVGTATKISDRTCDGTGGTNGGQIDFTPASGGSGSGYTYSVDGVNFGATLSFPNLLPGIYTPIIEDGAGCRLELTPIEIFDIDPPTDLGFVQSNSNCATSTSDVQLVPTSNAPITNYAIISPITVDNLGNDTFVGLSTTTSYIFQITDANGCIYQEGFSPALISSIRARVRAGGDLRVCTGATDGTGTFLVDGFANNYTYNINGGTESAPQNNAEVNLPPSGAGTYTITVTDVDTGCTDTAAFTIAEPAAPIDLSGSSVTPMSCANNNLGRVVANVSGGWGGYRYTLIYPGGGTTVGPRSSGTFGNLATASTPGNPYTLIVEDAEGCTDTFIFDLDPVAAPTIAIDGAATDLCYEPATGATIAVSSTAGSAPLASHQYRINGGPLQAGPVFTGIGPGTHTIEVVDGNNCSDTVPITINSQLRVRTNIQTEIPCGGAPGQIRVRVDRGYVSGIGPKQYEVSSDGGLSFGAPSPLATNTFIYDTTVPGDYVFRVTDNEGCIRESVSITLNPPLNIAPATWDEVPVSCGGTDNGRVTITPDATDGIPPYEINFDGRGWSSQTVYSDLAAGTYSYLVRDARGCETPLDNVVITTDTTPVPDATVNDLPATCTAGTVSGGIEITSMAGGTPNFTFIVEDAFGAEITRLDNVDPLTLPIQIIDPSIVLGDYTVITLDANGCRDMDAVTITTNEVVINPINFTPAVTCNDTGFTYTVEVTPTIFPTLPTYQIRLAGQPAFYALNNNFGPDTHEFSNATDGIQYGVAYTVEVLAPNGCIYEEEIPPIDGFSDLEISAVSDTAFCDNFGNGNANFTVVDFLGPDLDIEILNLDTGTVVATDNPTGLTGGIGSSYSGSFDVPPGSYQILVTDSDGCTDATNVDIFLNSPSIDILNNEPANCNALGQLTFQGSGGTPFATGSPYLYAVVPLGDPVAYGGPADTTDSFTEETTRTLAGSLAGITYEIWVVDSRGCTFNVTQQVVQLQPDLVVPTPIVVNQCDPTSTSFDITVWMPDTTDTPRFTLNGDEQLGVLNIALNRYEYTYNVNSPGDYPISVVDANGCTGTGTASVAEFLFASVGSVVQPSCADNDGEITISATGGSGNFDYELTGIDFLTNPVGPINQSDDPLFTGLAPGTYSVTVLDRDVMDGTGNCTVTINTIEIEEAIDLAIDTVRDVDISCNGETDGNITVNIDPANPGDSPLTFTLYESGTTTVVATNGTGFFDNLGMGTYDVVAVSAKNCEDRRNGIAITEPVPFSITAAAPDFVCAPGANRFSSSIITVTVIDPGTLGSGYQFGITENLADIHIGYQSASTFEVVDNGSPRDFIVYAIDGNGCRTEFNLPTINPPTGVVPTIVNVEPLDCANPETVRIQVTGTADFTVNTISAVPVGPVSNAVGVDFVEVDLPTSGDYLFEIQDNIGGCAYPLPVHTVDAPVLPTVTISEAQPVVCFGDSSGALFIEVRTYTGEYDYIVYRGDDLTKTTPIASGTFNTNDYPDASGDPARIPNLPGGNFFVEVVSTDAPFCSADSGIANIGSPTGPLGVTTIPVGNVSCTNDTGIIEATGELGWVTAPYEYRLLRSTDNGVTYPDEVEPFSTNHEFTGLPFGFYRVEVRDAEGCVALDDIELEEVPQLDAGIREPQSLVCPNGNNAILEAYDPTTGDASTAVAGATGGFAGAGYNYRLLYLNSNNNTDIHSTSGLQNTPTFATATGQGYLSAGWYAIEVSSSFGCLFVTDPYRIDPPPPIQPRLVQTQVPGCGGDGQMRLSIENHDPASGFEYEYRRIPTPDPINDPWTDMGTGASFVLLDRPGSPTGISYQYEVRKKNITNICQPVNSNGITLTDAFGVTINVNTPDDISCASELDGRIESFVSGGVGNNVFFLYEGDPVDAFSPDFGARFLNQNFTGTFEGLDEGTDYYVAVTSGLTCFDVNGPHAVIRPDPILTDDDATPVSCNGESDGTLTVTVTSGGEGLIQFAIAPNFNEFFSDPVTPGSYTFDELPQGDYEVLVLDEKGCFVTVMVNVPEPDPLSITNIETTPELCIGANNGTVVFEIAGGTPFVDALISPLPYYEYKIEMVSPVNELGTAVFAPYDGSIVMDLEGGASYTINVQDANGCSVSEVFTVGIGVDLTAQPIVVYGCEGVFPNSTSSVLLQERDLLPQVLFALDVDDINNADTTRSWGDLTPGDHTVYIYHENGCVNSVDFTVDAYDPLALSAVKTGPNELTATASGGFGGYEYFFQGQSYGEDNVYTTNVSELVEVRVVDQNGCEAMVSVPFEFTGMLEIPNFFTPDGDTYNDLWEIGGREFFPNIEVIIYDRYGRVIATLDQVQNWDGTYEGSPLPTGDYWYVVNQNDGRDTRFVGHFTLYR